MRTEFKTVRTDQTLGEAMVALREAQAILEMPNALMVVDGDITGWLWRAPTDNDGVSQGWMSEAKGVVTEFAPLEVHQRIAAAQQAGEVIIQAKDGAA